MQQLAERREVDQFRAGNDFGFFREALPIRATEQPATKTAEITPNRMKIPRHPDVLPENSADSDTQESAPS